MNEKIVRIGGASAFWGDSSVAAPQLVRRGDVDYLVFDFLAEVTLSIMVNARRRDPAQGYAGDFVHVAMAQVLRELKQKGIRVVTNAGGMNPAACADAVRRLAAEQQVTLKVAHVEGDDLLPRIDGYRGAREMFSGAPMPAAIVSANAYLGALPIARALDAGADIVITGRCADSALALGPLIHEFGWAADDWDRLAAGTLAGHILECGAQGAGGLHTDWRDVPRWEDIGYTIAACRADGTFVVTKAEGTGGRVTPAAVAEQMLYEVGDPGAYIVPDVVCDFRAVTMTQAGPDRVEVRGARGRPATPTYKVSAMWLDGWRTTGTLTIVGIDAAAKAQRTAEAILARTRTLLRERNLGDYAETSIEIIGAEHQYGPHARVRDAREVVMKLGVIHAEREALEIFAREITPAATSWSPGTTGTFAAGRAEPVPLVRLFSFLAEKGPVPVSVQVEGGRIDVPVPHGAPYAPPPVIPVPDAAAQDDTALTAPTRLIELCWARSGDKGDSANIGLIARDPKLYPVLRREVTAERVRAYFAHLMPEGEVTRFDVPGVHGLNFLLTGALGGGGSSSLRNDPLAKGFAQMLLDMEIAAPSSLAL